MFQRLRKKLPASWQQSRIWETPNTDAQQRLAFDQQMLLDTTKRRRVPSFGQLKYVSSFFTARERFVVVLSALAIAMSLVCVALFVYWQFVQPVPAQGGTYREAVVGTPLYINPILASTNDVDLDLTRLMFAGLLRYDDQLQLQPDMAESWSISEDKKTYTFVLRTDVYWHDNQPVTADDVVFTVRSIQDPALNSPLQLSFQGVTVEALNEHTVRLALPEPFAPFASVLTTGILPAHIWSGIPTSTMRLAEANVKPIGNGPWKFEKLEKDKQGNLYSYTLIPSDAWYGNQPFVQSLSLRFFSDFNSAIDALNSKKVDGMSFVPRQLVSSITNTQNYKTFHLQLPQYTALFFNNKNNSALKDKTVRQAIAYSIDRQRLIQDALDGLGTIVNGPLLPGMGGYEELEGYPFNPIEAQRLLETAGWKAVSVDDYIKAERERLKKEAAATAAAIVEGETTESTETLAVPEEPVIDTGNQAVFRQKDNAFLSLRLTTVDQPENKRAAELLMNALQTIGFKVELDIVSVTALTNTVLPERKYEALLYGQILNGTPDLYPFWHSSQIEYPGLNLANYADKDGDKLLTQARATTSDSERADLYKQFVKLLDKDTTSVFLYSPQYTYLLPAKMKGFDLERIGIPADRFIGNEAWYLKTQNEFRFGTM